MKDFKVNQFIFYSLPENAFVYRAIANRAGAVSEKHKDTKILSLYNVFDALKLSRVVGTKNACNLILAQSKSSSTNVHMFNKN